MTVLNGVQNMFEIITVWLKMGGAALGSSIAVVFRPGGDGSLKLFQRFVIGTILGFIFAPQILDFFGWTRTPDYWLAAACLGGLISYLLLQALFSEQALQYLLKLKSPRK